jgi:hypothetical protein
MSEIDDLKNQLAALQQQRDELLHKAVRSAKNTEFNAREDNREGAPGLTFEGPLRKPFFIGVNKLRTIQACWYRVERFLESQPRARNPSSRSEEPDQI